MGWSNPPVPWKDLERALSGRSPTSTRSPFRTMDRNVGPTYSAHPHHRRDDRPAEDRDATPVVPYVELHAHSAFSFLDGASTPEQLVAEALLG